MHTNCAEFWPFKQLKWHRNCSTVLMNVKWGQVFVPNRAICNLIMPSIYKYQQTGSYQGNFRPGKLMLFRSWTTCPSAGQLIWLNVFLSVIIWEWSPGFCISGKYRQVRLVQSSVRVIHMSIGCSFGAVAAVTMQLLMVLFCQSHIRESSGRTEYGTEQQL